MTLLAPFALFGVLLLALPVLVHLFKPRKMRQTPFSSLRWLKQTHQRLSRRIQWHQWLLFFMRAGLILLLVLALARPLIGWSRGGKPVDRIIIVDGSHSMGYQARELPTPLDKARDLASTLLANSRPGDRTGLVLAGASPRVLLGLTADGAGHADAVRAILPGQGDASLSTLLPLVRSMLADSERDLELVFLTDNRKRRWQQSDMQTFLKHRSPRIEIVDVGPAGAQNAWISQARLLTLGSDGDQLLRVTVGFAGDGTATREVRLGGIEGCDTDAQTVTLQQGQTARVDFRIPAKVNLTGQVAEVRLEPADALPADDVYFASLDTAWSLRVQVIDPESLGLDARPIGLNLVRGAESLSASNKQVLQVETQHPAALGADSFSKADVIFLAGVPELSAAALEGLENRVRAGAGLVIFLGPQVRQAFYNQALHKPLRPDDSLLPLALKTGPEVVFRQGNPGLLTHIQWSHPLLAPLYDPVLGDLPQARFRTFCSFVGTPTEPTAVLARLDDDTPALIEHPFGKGRVLIVNTTANADWTDLPLKRSFITLLDRMLTYLGGGFRREFSAGETVMLPLPSDAADEKRAEVAVVTPNGSRLVPRFQTVRGQTVLHLDDVAEIGVYRLERDGKLLFPFVVNAGRGDSPLGTMDAKVLETWWAPAPVEVLTPEGAAERFQSGSSSVTLWPVLVLLGGLLLLAETIYVHRLCPRVNPGRTESVVPDRGVLKPVGK